MSNKTSFPAPQSSSNWGDQQQFVEQRIKKLYEGEQKHKRLFAEKVAYVSGRDPDELDADWKNIRFGNRPGPGVGAEAAIYRVLDACHDYHLASLSAGEFFAQEGDMVQVAELERNRARFELHKVLAETMCGGIRTVIDLEQRADIIAAK